MSTPVTDRSPIYRRIYCIDTQSGPHFFPIVTLERGKSYTLFDSFRDNVRILAPGTTLFMSECEFFEQTQYRTNPPQIFDNPDLDVDYLEQLAKDHPSLKTSLDQMQVNVGNGLGDSEVLASTKRLTTIIHDYFVLGAVLDNGKANYDKISLVVLASSDSNAFIARIPFTRGFPPLWQANKVGGKANNTVQFSPLAPMIYHVAESSTKIADLENLFFGTTYKLITSGKFTRLLPYAYRQYAITAECLDAILHESVSVLMNLRAISMDKECLENDGVFIEGVQYPTLPLFNKDKPHLEKPTDYDLVAIDDNGHAMVMPTDLFSSLPIS